MNTRLCRFAVAGLALFAAGPGCGSASPPAPNQTAGSSETLELRVGEKATVQGEALVLTFVGVAEDSRCPKGEQCLQAGRVRLNFEGVPRGGETRRFELDSSREGETEIGGYWITLVDVQPIPVSGRSIAPQDYAVKIRIQRSSTQP